MPSLSDHLTYQSTINNLFENSDAFNLDISVFRQSLNSNTTPRWFRITPNLPSTKQKNKHTFPYASFIAAKSFISARNTFTLTTDFKLDPAASKTAPKFFKHCVCSQFNSIVGVQCVLGYHLRQSFQWYRLPIGLAISGAF